MTSPRPYGGAYHSSPSFADTPIYDSLVAERGTPQIAPIRVPSAYEPQGGYQHAPAQPALPALPALPSGPSPQPHAHPGYQAAHAPQPGTYVPQQAAAPRPYPSPQGPQAPSPQQMRPAAPRPVPPRQMPGGYQNPYPAQPRQQYPGPGYWTEQ